MSQRLPESPYVERIDRPGRSPRPIVHPSEPHATIKSEVREEKQSRARALLRRGHSINEVALDIGTHSRTVQRWKSKGEI